MGSQLTSGEVFPGNFSDLSGEWNWQTDSSLILTHLGQNYEGLTGRNPAELLGRSVVEAFAGLGDPAMMDVPAFICALQGFICEHRPFDDLEITFADRGRKICFSLRGRPAFDEGGTFCGYYGIAREITARKRAEDEAAHIGRLYNELLEGLDALGDGFTLFDAEGRLVLCNDVYRQMYPEIAELIRPGVSFE